jgi:tetratricopeptide (TPR) repeat protein
LVFLLDQEALAGVDLGAKIARFRERLLRQEGWTVCLFKSKEELVDRVAEAIREVDAGGRGKRDPRGCLINFGRLPDTPPDLFGRQAEIERLSEAWSDERTNVFCLWGLGGTGKSSLINYWLINDFLSDPAHRGARRILGWSFYAGAPVAGAASADSFMDSMFQWLREENSSGAGAAETIKIPGDPWQKGSRLAELIQQERTLLILDGLEAIVEKTSENTGVLHDVAMKALLRSLAANNPGLCLISSRLRIEDLQTFRNRTVKELHLSRLSPEAGVELLKSLGVHGSPAELEDAVQEYGGHAFSLRAVGNLLKKYCRGNVSDRKKLAGVASLKTLVSGLLRWYETCLGEGPELDVLRMISVFRGPAPGRALDALRTGPVIPGLTDHVTGPSDLDWNAAIDTLVELELVIKGRGSPPGRGDPDGVELLETHALVRDHFSQQLKKDDPQAWREANDRLFEFYRSSKPDLPEDFAAMLPLFRAVAHGCEAGRYREAWHDVEWRRIRRGDMGFCVVNLGAWGEDLAALTSFFDSCWDRPAPALDDVAKAWLLTETAFDLRGLGRLSDAIRPLTEGLAAHKANGDWWAACDAVGNLAELLTLWGDLANANSAAKESIELAGKAVDLASSDQEKDKATKTLAVNVATLAEVEHQQGLLDSAERGFREADRLYASVAGVSCISGARGFHFCDLLLDLNRTEEVDARAPATLEIDRAAGRGHGVGLARLAQAQSLMAQFRHGSIADLTSAGAAVREAYDSLTQFGFQPYVIRARLAVGSWQLLSGRFDQALSRIDEALEAADRGQMRLLYIDGLLEKVRTLLALNKIDDARQCIEAAASQTGVRGYHRRDAAVAGLLAQCRTSTAST